MPRRSNTRCAVDDGPRSPRSSRPGSPVWRPMRTLERTVTEAPAAADAAKTASARSRRPRGRSHPGYPPRRPCPREHVAEDARDAPEQLAYAPRRVPSAGGRALDVGEEEGDGAGRELTHRLIMKRGRARSPGARAGAGLAPGEGGAPRMMPKRSAAANSAGPRVSIRRDPSPRTTAPPGRAAAPRA